MIETVGDLIGRLQEFDKDLPIIFNPGFGWPQRVHRVMQQEMIYQHDNKDQIRIKAHFDKDEPWDAAVIS